MLSHHEYVQEKVRKFDLEALERRPLHKPRHGSSRSIWGTPLVVLARTIRRACERIEKWAAPEPMGQSGPHPDCSSSYPGVSGSD